MQNKHENGSGKNSPWWKLWRRPPGPSPDQSAYSRLALQLHYDLPRETGSRTVLLLTPKTCRTGAGGGLQLAYSLGQELGRPVLLIDACPPRPEISQALACAQLPGWSELLHNPNLDLHSLTLPTSSEHVRFLPAGTHAYAPPAPEDIQARLKTAQKSYDFVVLFGGSVLDDLTSLALPAHVGCVLLLVAENETLTADLEAAEGALALRGAHNVRLVLTTPLRGNPGLLMREDRPEARAAVAGMPSWASEKGS